MKSKSRLRVTATLAWGTASEPTPIEFEMLPHEPKLRRHVEGEMFY